MGYLGISSRLPNIEDSFGELGKDRLVVIMVYDTGVCHGPVPAVDNKFSLRIDT